MQGTVFIFMFVERTAVIPLVGTFEGMQSRGCYYEAGLWLAENVNQIWDVQDWME